MLHLVVSAPGGRKAELECEPSATFGDVKTRIEQTLGVPPDKQKLLCNGKERKNPAETLASAGVTGKSKLMLMLAPGYQMPAAPPAAAPSSAAAPAAEDAGPQAVEEESAEAEAIELEGQLPLRDGVDAPMDGSGGIIHIRQGKNRYHVKVPQGLAAANFGELSDYLVASLLFPPGLPAHELRLIHKGKTAERSQPLAQDASNDTTVMLLFREGFHLGAEGATWLKEQSSELDSAEATIEKIRKKVEANFTNEETYMQMQQVVGLIEMLKHSVEIVRVRQAALPDMAKFRDRVLKADATLQELKKRVRL